MESLFTDADIENFRAYEKVRAEGRFNMLDSRSIKLTGLSREDYISVLNNYSALKEDSDQRK